MITPEQIVALMNSPYARDVPDWKSLPPDPVKRVTLLRRSLPADVVPAVLELAELRSRAATKFSSPHSMFFDREGLEQATPEEVAALRATYFQGVDSIADLTCGIGSDAAALARSGSATIAASDISPARVSMAGENCRVLLGDSANITFCVARADDYPAAGAYFLDPSRRRDGRRSRRLSDLSPSARLIGELSQRCRGMAVKLSPATSDDELAALSGRLQFVSHHGECKEAVVWFGCVGPQSARNAVICGFGEMASVPGTPAPPVSRPLAYLLEPDPAIIRAGLIPELCRKIDAAVVDPRVGYLTSDAPGPRPFVTSYRTLASMPFSTKPLKKALRDLQVGRVEIKKRASAVDIDHLRKDLSGSFPREATVLITRIGEKPWVFIAERCTL